MISYPVCKSGYLRIQIMTFKYVIAAVTDMDGMVSLATTTTAKIRLVKMDRIPTMAVFANATKGGYHGQI